MAGTPIWKNRKIIGPAVNANLIMLASEIDKFHVPARSTVKTTNIDLDIIHASKPLLLLWLSPKEFCNPFAVYTPQRLCCPNFATTC